MTDPDIQTARVATLRRIFDELHDEPQRIFQEALDEYDRTMRRALAIYLLVILALLIAIAFHISRTPPSAALPT